MNKANLATGFALGLVAGIGIMIWIQEPSAPALEAMDPDAMHEATLAALEHPDTTERTVLLARLLDRVTDENIESMFSTLEQRVSLTNPQDIRLVVRALARRDPQGTFERVMLWPRNRIQYAAPVAIFEWAAQEPIAAREAARQVEDPPNAREPVHRNLIYGWAWGRKPGLSEFLRSLSADNPNLSEFVIQQAAEINRHEGSAATFEWALEQIAIGDPTWSKLVFEQAVNAVGAKHPHDAAAFVEQHLDQPHAAGGPKFLALSWSTYAPAETIEWLETLPPGQAQFDGIFQAWRTWHLGYPAAANQWLSSREPGPLIDGALAAYAKWYMRPDPAGTLELMRRMSDESRLRDVQVQIIGLWLRRDPAKAEAWLANRTLPQETLAAARAEALRKPNMAEAKREIRARGGLIH